MQSINSYFKYIHFKKESIPCKYIISYIDLFLNSITDEKLISTINLNIFIKYRLIIKIILYNINNTKWNIIFIHSQI